MREVKLKEVLTESKIPSESPHPDRRITVKLNVGGVEKRALIKDSGTTNYYTRKAGQFIYGRQNLFKGAFGVVPKELDGYESSIDLPAFDVSEKCTPEWIVYFLHAGERYKHLETLSKGSGSKRIHPRDLLELSIPLPSIEEQQIILGKIHKIGVIYKKTSSELQTQSDLITKLRSSILSDAVSGRLVPQDPADEPAGVLLERIQEERKRWIAKEKKDDNQEATTIERKIKKLIKSTPAKPDIVLPSNWSWSTILEASNLVVDCHNKTAPYTDNGIWIIRTTNIRNGVLNTNEQKFVNEDTYNYWSRRCPPTSGDIVYTREAPVGEVAIIPENTQICLGQRMMLIRPFHELLLKEYLRIVLMGPDFLKRLEGVHIGATVKHLRVGDVENAMIPIPPLAEQYRIVAKVEKLMATCDTLEAEVQKSRTETERLMQTILKEAFENKKESQTEAKAPKAFQRSVLAAYLIDNSQYDPFFGHVKLQKMLYMCEAVNSLDFDSDYKRHAMGPYDPKLIRSVDAQLKKAKWFGAKKSEGDKGRYVYHPMAKAEEYKKYLGRYWDQNKIEKIFELMHPMKTQQAEIVATLYSAWTDLTKAQVVISDEMLIDEARNHWHDNKKNISVDRWQRAIEWMRNKGLF